MLVSWPACGLALEAQITPFVNRFHCWAPILYQSLCVCVCVSSKTCRRPIMTRQTTKQTRDRQIDRQVDTQLFKHRMMMMMIVSFGESNQLSVTSLCRHICQQQETRVASQLN